ncbi:uncharacterized protein LOC130237097 [Danio aesculapii]|uniref:uncharacterized protein LOC130237097 n=1 Tax=Danio aesculapii TaxID=1142201 RepID=UPI0024BFEC46|nr:uncharacterized protein LOC130237097 [Danio aesculapii]
MMLHIFLISWLFLEVQPLTLFEQLWLTTSPSTVQNNSNIRYEAQDTSSVQPHYITGAKKRFSLDEKPEITVNYDSQNAEFRVYCEIPGSDNADSTSVKEETTKQNTTRLDDSVFTNSTFISISTTQNITATKSSTWSDSTINSTSETAHSSQPLNVTLNMTVVVNASSDARRTPATKSWIIMILTATGGGILLSGLLGICLFCMRQKPRKMSMKPSIAVQNSGKSLFD